MSDHDGTLNDAARALAGAGSVVVCAHVHPDGDAVGATLGVVLALRSLGIEATPTLADGRSAPATYAFLPGHDLYRTADEIETPDVFLALDSPNWSRIGDAECLARAAGTLVVIDHHPDNTRFGHVNVVDSTAASTGQIIWDLLPLMGAARNADVATCLYVATMTDTGRFSYGNTDARVLRDAAAMVEAGVDAFHAYAVQLRPPSGRFTPFIHFDDFLENGGQPRLGGGNRDPKLARHLPDVHPARL